MLHFNYVYCAWTFYGNRIRFRYCFSIAYCVLYSIVVIVVLPQLYEMNHNILNAARDLGATESQILSRVLIPNLMPAIIGGFYGFNIFIRRFYG